MAATFTSPIESTVIAAVWQLEDWVAHKVSSGAATSQAAARLHDMCDRLVRGVLADLDRTTVRGLFDEVRVFVSEPWNDLGLDDDDVDYFFNEFGTLAGELG